MTKQHVLVILRQTQTSTGEGERRLPFLYITSFRVVSDIEKLDHARLMNRVDNEAKSMGNNLSSGRDWSFQTGVVAGILSSKKFNSHTLMGNSFPCMQHVHQCEIDTHINIGMDEDADTITDFLEQHNAIMLLNNRGQGQLGPAGNLLSPSLHGSTQESLQNYLNSLLEFDRLQQEKEVLSIERPMDDNEEPKKVQETLQFKETLEYALTCKVTLEYALTCRGEPLNSEMLIRWHLWLMGDGVHEEAGNFRDYTRRCEGKELCPPEQIPKRIEIFCRSLESHWLPRIKSKTSDSREIVSFAAAALIGILDISPFMMEIIDLV